MRIRNNNNVICLAAEQFEREQVTIHDMPETPVRLDGELKTLASRERRKILDHFVSTDTEVETVEVLSCQLARLQVDTGNRKPTSTEAAKAELHHVHLPKLEECGLIEYDPRSGTVRYQPDERVEALVQFLSEL